jgi:hypothetical protein
MVAVATTQPSRSLAPTSGKKNDRRNGNTHSKSHPSSGSDFFSFQNPGKSMCKFHNFCGNKAHKFIFSCSWSLPNPYRFGGKFSTGDCHSNTFPANAGLIFLMEELIKDRYLVDTGATLSLVPCTSNASPSGPLLKGADGQPIPSWYFVSKTVQFQGKRFTAKFLQAAVAGPILALIS